MCYEDLTFGAKLNLWAKSNLHSATTRRFDTEGFLVTGCHDSSVT